jgi:NAD(P)-dependent dehydrogenase (short-subunit alcohol dehydrogenase family)
MVGAMTPLFASHPFKALVIGSNGVIGGAFVDAFRSDPLCSHVEALSRKSAGGFDLLNEESIRNQAELVNSLGPFEIIIDATGALEIEGWGPEKSLASLNQDRLMKSFLINAIGPALVIRHFSPLLSKGASIYTKLSARVGSIGDNKKGGWYGYRASKAALNMLLQTAAIELQRKNMNVRVVALQPGTVRSRLSNPFVGAHTDLLDPMDSVSSTLEAMKHLTLKSGAHFIDFKGNEIAW